MTKLLRHRYGFAVASWGRTVYAVGGSTKGSWTGAAFAYDIDTCGWEELPKMKVVRRRCGAAAFSHLPPLCSLDRQPSPLQAKPALEGCPPQGPGRRFAGRPDAGSEGPASRASVPVPRLNLSDLQPSTGGRATQGSSPLAQAQPSGQPLHEGSGARKHVFAFQPRAATGQQQG